MLTYANLDASVGALQEVERTHEQINALWPAIKIVLRSNARFVFAQAWLMAWCEDNATDYAFDLACQWTRARRNKGVRTPCIPLDMSRKAQRTSLPSNR